MFLKNGEGWTDCARTGGRGKHSFMYLYCDSAFGFSLQKIFGSNLTLHARLVVSPSNQARGVPAHHWFSVAAATENQSETDLVSLSIYNAARTHFSTNAD